MRSDRLVLGGIVLAVIGFWSHSWLLPGLVAVLTLGASAYLHPYADCGTCGGRGVHRSWWFPWARRPCHACSGSGTKQRATAAVLGRGRPRKSSSRIVPPTRSFGGRR